jgi:DNA repair protein RadA/Sms
MAKKNTTVFVCSSCGYETSKWLGKCPSCGEWNTFVEEKAIVGTGSTKEKFKEKGEIVKLKDVEKKSTLRIKTGVGELDRVLGGGFVEGSLTLLGGEPRNW